MDESEFKEVLQSVGKEFNFIAGMKTVYFGTWPTEEHLPVLNRHKGFFVPVREALRQSMLMAAARVVDRDTRTASIPNLIAAARNDASLLPHAAPDRLDKIEGDALAVSDTVERLVEVRNRRLAHHDRGEFELPTITKEEFEQLLAAIKDLFNDLSSALDRSVTSWLQVESDADWHTKLLFEVAELGSQARSENIRNQIEEETGTRPTIEP